MRDGADGFETDYWTTHDARIVSHHDATLDRMTDGSGSIGGRTWTYVRGVRNSSGAPVPTLRGVERRMASYGGRRQQEIKDGAAFSRAMLEQVLRIDRAHGRLAGRVLITSSQLPTLRRVHALAPRVGIGLIDRTTTGRPRLSRVPGWVDVLAIDLRAADAKYVARARAAGHAVSVRNVDTVLQLHAAVALGVRRVVTNMPEVLGRSC